MLVRPVMRTFTNPSGTAANKMNTSNLKTCQCQTLSHELRQRGEGAISLEECTEVLSSFPLNKVSGNGG